MFRRRRLFAKKKQGASGEIALPITAMADIFTVLLVFLLKGISSDALQISPSNETTLPPGVHTTNIDEKALQVEVSRTGILIEKEFVTPLQEYRLDSKTLTKEGTITTITERLTKERERQRMIASVNDDVKIDTRAIIMSDQHVPFSTMKLVLRSLAAQGYSEIKFAVVKE